MADVASRLQTIQERVAAAAADVGRSPDGIQIIAVSKRQTIDRINEAYDAGQRFFGENRVPEAQAKWSDPQTGIELHLIGHLQSNKAKLVPGLFSWVDSVDSLRIAESLSRRAEVAGTRISVLIQFDSSGEESKSGYRDEELFLDDAAAIAALPSIDLRGIMTIGPNTDDWSDVAAAFGRTRRLFERLRNQDRSLQINVLSMGMSADFPIAIAEGSTQIRVGSAIFGPRDE